ncbi:calcineurin-like phosphoesterase family protein [Georgenia soli]|uniref:Calcineurin-like phosphoesterase family protein n=1 Tax=Georgenia soli TaxID=638953 RepID=A0A2A9EKS9_9MICO|nr:metallophosphoesterase [Georgenia soli]PFG39508.1 calcineurin-like phosphoesterase family protein [Georgenia soli]
MRRLVRIAVVAGMATLPLGAGAVAAPAVPSAVDAAPAPQPGFRVLPYLQQPGEDTMTLSWVSETDEPGTVTVSGPGLRGKTTLTSEPRYLDLMEYTEAELAQEIRGLEQGSWLLANSSYKHTVTLDGLKADHTYRYTVEQGDEQHTASFTTAPTAERWKDLRLIAFSDTETEPYGAVEHREWELHPQTGYAEGSAERPGPGSLWAEKYGSTTRYGEFTLRYPMDQQRALIENTQWIEKADPDLMLIAGDLAQGSGYQPAWDEFWRHFAGEYGNLATHTPLITALGNWETYAALNGGYGTDEDRTPAVIARNRYHEYFDTAGDAANPQFEDSYHRVDYGPLTVLTLDSTNGLPDEDADTGMLSGEVYSGDDTNLTEARKTTDTQGEFTAENYDSAFTQLFPGTTAEDSDLPNFNPGTEQWAWAEKQLADAREQGQIVVVQFHHAAYSNGVHGTPPNHEHADNQSGVAMRVYTPLFEKYGVAAVISGHDEMFERSWVDEDGDGVGFHSYDVGVAADGLRGEQLAKNADGEYVPIRYNSHSEWTAAADEPELWEVDANGNPQLLDGGLHYGHLQMDLTNTRCGAEMTLSPVYLFPVLDENYDLVRTERRVYDDVVTVTLADDGTPVAGAPECQPGRGTAPGQQGR